MRLASVEVIPYALPFREPYVTARGRLDRREMVLLRLRDDDGLDRAGRSGAALAARRRDAGAGGRASWSCSPSCDELDEASLRGGVADLSAPARCAALTALLDLRGRRAAAGGPSAPAAGEPVALQRDAGRRRAGGGRRGRAALGRRGLLHLQAEARRRRRRRPGAGGARGGRAGGADPGRRQRGLGRWRRRSGRWRELEPLEIELAEQPVATLEEAAELAARDLDPARRRRERREPRRRRAGGRARRLRADRGEALQGRRARRRRCEIAEVLPAYLSSALDGPVGIAAAAQVAQTLREGAPAGGARPRPRPRHPAPLRRRRSPRSSASCATAMLHLPAGPRPRRRDRRGRAARAPALAWRGAFVAAMTGQTRHSPRWTRPTPTPRSPRPSSRSWRAAGCGTRSSPPARARRRWRWRSGGQPEIEVTVIVDERSAGFFALGAAQASGAPVALLCTSGTAAANYHPAVCEADESALPLLVLTRRPAAGAARDRRRADDRPDQALRLLGALVLRSRDPRGRRRRAAPLPLGRLPGAGGGARRDPRPGPVHLNLPWREPLAPVAGRGRGDRDRPAGAGGTRRAAADRGDPDRPRALRAFLLDEVAGHIGDAIAGVIVAGRQLDPELREPLAHLARVSGFPILAEPTSQLRCGPHDRSHVVAAYDLLLRDERFARSVVPDLVLRFGEMPTSKPLRAWLAASGADQIVVDPCGGWNEPSRPRRGDPARRPDRAGRRAGRRGWRAEEPSAGARALARRRAGGPGGARRPSSGERRADHRARPAPRARRRPPRRRPRLHRLEHADPRPGGLPRRRRDRRALPLQPRRQRHRRPDLLRDRRRPRQRPPDHDRHRRPRPAPRPRRPRRPARRLHPGPHRRHRQRRRRHLPLPAPGARRSAARSSRRCSAPRAASTSPRPRPSSTSPTAASSPSPSSPTRSPPAPA